MFTYLIHNKKLLEYKLCNFHYNYKIASLPSFVFLIFVLIHSHFLFFLKGQSRNSRQAHIRLTIYIYMVFKKSTLATDSARII